MKKLNNKGLSLVELIIAISMATMVIAAATVFLYNAERSYRISQYSIDLQMEAQVLMEQMSNWVLESNHMEAINSGKTLILYQIPKDKMTWTASEPAPATLKCKKITLYQKNAKLYMLVDDTSDETALRAEIAAGPSFELSTAPTNADDCIGEHVEDFEVSYPSTVESTLANSVQIKLNMKEGGAGKQGRSYIVSNVFSFRNSVYTITPTPSATPTTP